MAVPTIPSAISLNAINIELGQGSQTANMNMNTQASQHLPSALSQPHGVDEWSGYTHATYGRMFGEDDWSGTLGFMYSPQNTTYYQMGTTEAELYSSTVGTENSTKCTYNNSGGSFIFGDAVIAEFYRRTKNTGGSWTTVAIWNLKNGYYLSQTQNCDFSTYDYKWRIS